MNEYLLMLICPPICALLAGMVMLLTKPKNEDADETIDQEGAEIRASIYNAYRGMVKQHAHGLWMLTACLSQESPSRDVALYALEQTAQNLSRFNTAPIRDAIEEIKGIGD